MEGMEELVLLVGMGAEQTSLALVQLELGCFNGSSHTPLLCDQGGNLIVGLMITLQLSCDPPVLLGAGVVVHGSVHGVIGEGVKEPMREFSLLIDSDALWWEEFVPVDRLTDAGGAQAVQAILFDVGGKDMHDMITIDDWDEEIKDVSFVFLISFWSSLLRIPLLKPLVIVGFPVLIGLFQMSCVRFMFCQVFPSLLEYFKLFLIVMADFLVLLHNSHQPLCNEEEFLLPW